MAQKPPPRMKLTAAAVEKLKPEAENAAEIARLVSFVDQHRKGWTVPSGDIPIPRVRADFYDGPTFVAGFGVGRAFFETHRNGVFLSKTASESDQKKFLELIGLSPGILDN